jgi:hypothetical protein
MRLDGKKSVRLLCHVICAYHLAARFICQRHLMRGWVRNLVNGYLGGVSLISMHLKNIEALISIFLLLDCYYICGNDSHLGLSACGIPLFTRPTSYRSFITSLYSSCGAGCIRLAALKFLALLWNGHLVHSKQSTGVLAVNMIFYRCDRLIR